MIGRFELYSTARHDLGFFKNVACAATYSSSASSAPIKEIVYSALHKVIARHPMLSAIVINEDKKDSEVYFARLKSVNLDTCVEFIEQKSVPHDGEDAALETCLQGRINTSFKEGSLGSRPFWHLRIMLSTADPSTFTAAWFFHHALGDGGCGPIFHRTLLSALQDVSVSGNSSEPPNHIVRSPSTPLLPPFEALHSHPVSWSLFLRTILGLILPSVFDPRPPKLWTGPRVTAPDPLPNTKIQIVTLPAPTTAKLLKISRENKTTMQATLECCIATAIFLTLPAETYDKIIGTGPISVRSIIKNDDKPIADDEFVLALAEYTHTHMRTSHTATQFSWDEARAVRASIQAELAKKGTDNRVSLLRYVSDMHKFYIEKIGQERKISFELSNLGALKAEVRGEGVWKIGKCVFSQSANVSGPPIVCSAVTGGDGQCVLAFSWLESVVGEEMMKAVVEGVEKQVEVLVR